MRNHREFLAPTVARLSNSAVRGPLLGLSLPFPSATMGNWRRSSMTRRSPPTEEPCWCRSGKAYGQCHRAADEKGPLPEKALVSKLLKSLATNPGVCWHPTAPTGCSAQVIRAHTVQRRGPLRNIADAQNHVRTFFPPERDAFGQPIVGRIGWKEASTFFGFCSLHDEQLFRPIETIPFQGTALQVSLIGYRAICHEIHKKMEGQTAMKRHGLDLLKGLDPAERKRRDEIFSLQHWGRQKAIEEMGAMAAVYRNALKTSEYSSIDGCVVHFEGDLSVASSGLVTPDFTVDGRPLQELHEPGMQGMAFGTTLTERGAAVAFSWPRDYGRMRSFVDSLTALPPDNLATALVLFVFSYVENTFFSSSWWEALASSKRCRIGDAALTTNQSYTPVNYRCGRLVPWRITEIVGIGT
jgi:SEC-C motif